MNMWQSNLLWHWAEKIRAMFTRFNLIKFNVCLPKNVESFIPRLALGDKSFSSWWKQIHSHLHSLTLVSLSCFNNCFLIAIFEIRFQVSAVLHLCPLFPNAVFKTNSLGTKRSACADLSGRWRHLKSVLRSPNYQCSTPSCKSMLQLFCLLNCIS
jgi:hypothetical protein